MMRTITLAMSSMLLLGVLLPGARADESDQRTVITFSQPVEIPGQVLPAGTYTFKVADSDHHIVQVFNKAENRLYGTFLTVPEYRRRTPDKTIITFEETAAGSPEAIKSWFYPGRNDGNEFLYSKKQMAGMTSHKPGPGLTPGS